MTDTKLLNLDLVPERGRRKLKGVPRMALTPFAERDDVFAPRKLSALSLPSLKIPQTLLKAVSDKSEEKKSQDSKPKPKIRTTFREVLKFEMITRY